MLWLLVRTATVVAVARSHSGGRNAGGGKTGTVVPRTDRARLGVPAVVEVGVVLVRAVKKELD